MVAEEIPAEQGKDGHTGGSKKGEESCGQGQQQAGEKPKAVERKTEKGIAFQRMVVRVNRHVIASVV